MSLTACKNMDSVFDQCTEDELDFDVLFDEDDELVDTVCGVKENGEPLTGVDFEQLHNTDDEAEPDDLRDALGPDNDNTFGAKKDDIEGSKEYDPCDAQEIDNLEKNGKADIDKFLDADHREDDYADGKADGKTYDNIDTVTGYIKKDSDIMSECDELDAAINPNGYPSDDGSDKPEPVSGDDHGDDADGKKIEDADVSGNADAEVEGEDDYQDSEGVGESFDIDSALDEDASENDDIDSDDDGETVENDVDECGGSIAAGVKVKEAADVDDALDDEVIDDVEDDTAATGDYTYDPSDEDLIDMVLGNKDE